MKKEIPRLNNLSGRALLCIMALLTLVTVGTSNAQYQGGTQSISSCIVIDKPGLYQLAKGIIATQNSLKTSSGSVPSCILIVADFVTLDLRGYTISGPGTGFGIYVHGGTASYVRDGAATHFDRGIALEGTGHTAKELRVTGNVGAGLTFDGGGLTAEEVRADFNGTGILSFGGSGNSVQHSEASANGLAGINLLASPGSSIIGNTVTANGQGGIVASCPSVILQNMAFQNAGSDISTDLPPPACTQSDNHPAP